MRNRLFLSYRRARLGLGLAAAMAISAAFGAAACNSPDGVLIPTVGAGGAGGGDAGSGGAGGAGGAHGPVAAWSRAFISDSRGVPTALAVDIDSSPVVAVQCNGQVSYGGPTDSTPGGMDDICVGKLGADGAYKWSVFAGTPEIDYVSGAGAIVRDTVLFGYFGASLHFDPGVDLVTNDHAGMFLVRLNEAGQAVWGKAFGTDNLSGEEPWSMAVDKDGNIVVAGSFQEAFDLDGVALVPMGYKDMFIAKFSGIGKLLWAKSFGGVDSYAEPRSVTTDKDGRILIGGSLDGTIDFKADVVAGAGSDDILLAVLDGNGDYVWGKSFGSVDAEAGDQVAVDSDGNIYLAGSQGYGCTLFGQPPKICGKDSDDVFIAKFTRNGDYLWAHGFGDATTQYLGDIAVNAAGDVYLTGFFLGSIDAGNGVTLGPVDPETMNYPCYDMFLVKYDAKGACVFSARYGDRNDDKGLNVAIGPDDTLIATGVYSKIIDFGDGPLTDSPPPLSLVFVTKLPL